MTDLGGERRLKQTFVNLNFHELPPVALRAFDSDLGSLLHTSVLCSAGLQPGTCPP
ncbi:MAG: hypothetical protein HYS33_07075 [Acidobacteria bacterium]|nr:hypothetical protein [Acidobacteriota bacterium]MBI1983098.1 hypothetical protein [Acidobacteriota bacterium]